jgi:3-oxoacyl-[acyl-carrier protein] reductase
MTADAAGHLAGRAALITGAGSGIGAATARRFAEEGARVFLSDVNADAIDAGVGELRARGLEAWASPLDVTDERATGVVVELARETMGRLDTVVANAGVLSLRTCAETTADQLEHVLRVNVVGVHNVFRHALPAVRAAGDGVLLATASLASSHGSASLGAYAASKFALLGLVQSLAQEEAEHGVRVCTVAPGFVRTGMMRDLAAERGGEAGQRKALEADLADKVALGRLATPAEVADVFVFLASPLARYVTGANVPVDGGYRS